MGAGLNLGRSNLTDRAKAHQPVLRDYIGEALQEHLWHRDLRREQSQNGLGAALDFGGLPNPNTAPRPHHEIP